MSVLETLIDQNYSVKPSENKKTKEKRKKEPTKRTSNFFMLLNSQRSVKTMSKEAAQKFQTEFTVMVRKFLEHDMWDFLIFTDSKSTTERWKTVTLEDRVTVPKPYEFVIEIGGEKQFIHAHMIYWTSHICVNVKLDYQAVWKYWKEKLDYCFFNAKIFRDNGLALKNYITKTSIDPQFEV
jgi:hypothetical protein